jgi:UDP-N-acetylglucosamine 2-epimerase (non-hydrolysing)
MTQRKISVHLIAAARPNFMKIAPLYHALRRVDWCVPQVIHTGQHYDANMSDAFFCDLRLPPPDFHLEVGSGTHAAQTAGVMVAYEKVCEQARPDWTIVVGDVNSTLACALVATKLGIPLVHLEAGLRSHDRSMPEELNRLATDAIADVLWTPSPDADENLLREGVAESRIDFVGNIMIDSYELLRTQIHNDGTRERMGLGTRQYAVVTLHRPSNVDDPQVLGNLVHQLLQVSDDVELVFPIHPRTRRRLEEFKLHDQLAGSKRISLTEPLGYIQFMNLVSGARLAITDSGGIQEETTYLGIPCLTLRENTERPITVTAGTNRLVGPQNLLAMARQALSVAHRSRRELALWDGHTAARCVAALAKRAGRG